MPDVEKVIHDLEKCLDDSVAAVVPADTVREVIALLKPQEPPTDASISSAIECLLHPQDADDSDMAKAIETAVRAMRLLKAQEPRLLTWADFEANPMLDDDGRLPCWCEDLICDSGWTAVSVGGVLPDHIKANGCRYWTSRPTDEQREATAWA